MSSPRYFVVNDGNVEIHARSSCGLFTLSTLPRNWRQQFVLPGIRNAILAELTAREELNRAGQRQTDHEANANGTVRLSWYSVRARLVPATVAPIFDPDCRSVAARELALPA